jgi:hypothetical protein
MGTFTPTVHELSSSAGRWHGWGIGYSPGELFPEQVMDTLYAHLLETRPSQMA